MKYVFSFFTLVYFSTAYAGDLQVTVNNIHNDKGYLLVSIYNDATAFKNENVNNMHTYIAIPAKTDTQTITLHDFPIGTYAISILHDENKNNQFNMDKQGTPLEGYAYSNNVGLTSTPTYEQAAFKHQQDNTSVDMKLLYSVKP